MLLTVIDGSSAHQARKFLPKSTGSFKLVFKTLHIFNSVNAIRIRMRMMALVAVGVERICSTLHPKCLEQPERAKAQGIHIVYMYDHMALHSIQIAFCVNCRNIFARRPSPASRFLSIPCHLRKTTSSYPQKYLYTYLIFRTSRIPSGGIVIYCDRLGFSKVLSRAYLPQFKAALKA
jgi:hypothetical protein